MNAYQEGIKTSKNTLIINIFLCIIKLCAGFFGKSKAMIADGVHTASDVITTIVVMVGLKMSSKSADEDHPYGHERFELEFAKILSIILFMVGGLIAFGAIKSLINKNEIPEPSVIALFAAVLSIVTKEIMYRYTIVTAKKISSVSMEADAWHHRSDAFSSVGTFVGILGARAGYPILDTVAAIVVSFMIIKVAVDLYLKSIKGLVDESAEIEIVDEIRDLSLSVTGVEGLSDLKTRVFSNKIYVDIAICVDGSLSVEEGHDIAIEVHDIIEKSIEEVKHCMVHVEPC